MEGEGEKPVIRPLEEKMISGGRENSERLERMQAERRAIKEEALEANRQGLETRRRRKEELRELNHEALRKRRAEMEELRQQNLPPNKK